MYDIEPTLYNVYSKLNTDNETIKDRGKLIESSFINFEQAWDTFINNFFNDMKTEDNISCLVHSDTLFIVQPMLFLLTCHGFQELEFCILANDKSMESKVIEKLNDPELCKNIQKKLTNIGINKLKTEREDMRRYFEHIGRSLYKKLIKEQSSELGCWFNKHQIKHHKQLYQYVNTRYTKLLKNCPLYEKLNKENRSLKNPFNEFVKLSKDRDQLGRLIFVKRYNKIEESFGIQHNYNYLRYFVLKKMLIRSISHKVPFDKYYGIDFNMKVIKKVFKVLPIVQEDIENVYDDKEPDALEESIFAKKKIYESEIITMNGTIFGELIFNSVYLSFHSKERKKGRKYKYGSTFYNQMKSVKFCAKWKLDEITEIIVKRYNLIRQAIEIYFYNNRSVLISLYDEKYLARFLEDFKMFRRKKRLVVEIIEEPEEYFKVKGFAEQWAKGNYSNIEYLMLLNKYGGRTFNDLNQYPVFPWILADYESKEIKLSDNATYRPLANTIPSLNEKNKTNADEKYDEKDEDSLFKYQFGTHYLPGRVVLGYMQRLHPYVSILLKFDHGHDAATRMFHQLFDAWRILLSNPDSSQELIPEFFYLPEMFPNYNHYSFGAKPEKGGKGLKRVRVDQVVFPEWAKNNHHFVFMNAAALEKEHVSLELNKWVDLIFGVNQQNASCYNVFKPLCNEDYVKTIKESLDENKLTEMQEFGVNPLRLFKEKHPQWVKKEVNEKRAYLILKEHNDLEKQHFSLLKVFEFEDKQPIVFVEAIEKKAYVILDSQNLYQTKENPINSLEERSLQFIKKPINLFPFKSLYCKDRAFACSPSGSIFTSHHYDNTFRIINNKISENCISFHYSMVTALYLSNTKLFAGSADGVISCWNINKYSHPLWCNTSHDEAVVSMDGCEKLGILISASKAITIRRICNGMLVRVINVEDEVEISHIRVSSRGYIVVILKVKDSKGDVINVYSINGEKIIAKHVKDRINAIVMNKDGYEFLTGGRLKHIYKYNLITLEEIDMLILIDAKQKEIKNILSKFMEDKSEITAMSLTSKKGHQQLLIGTSTGSLYTYKYSSRLIGEKVIKSFQNIM